MSTFKDLSAFLKQDPDNETLRLDCAEAARREGHPDDAMALLAPLLKDGHDRAISLSGLIHLGQHNYGEAETVFSSLRDEKSDDPALNFNLAWAKANLGKFDEALSLLTDDVAIALPQAATLKVQLHHQLGQFEEAAHSARQLTQIFPDNRALFAAASTVAMDISDADWAKSLAEKSPGHPEAQITLGSLALQDGSVSEAEILFNQALSSSAESPRALVGKGLCLMLKGENSGAASCLDQGAKGFGTHLGSWVAAGWAHVSDGHLETARERFETALEIDDTFAEIHGSLGVIDLLEGQRESAQKRIRTARRIDPACASAALGQILLLQDQDRPDAAKAVFEKAMETAIDENGTTLGQAMARIAIG